MENNTSKFEQEIQERVNKNGVTITDSPNLMKLKYSLAVVGNENTITSKIVDRSVSIYNNIIIGAVNLSLYQGDSSKSLYERIILESISKYTCDLKDMKGFIIKIKCKKKKDTATIYIGNVFMGSLYITNHLVITCPKEDLSKFKVGDMICFDGRINMYYDYNNNNLAKYGIADFKLTSVKKNMLNETIDKLNNLKEKYTIAYDYDDFEENIPRLVRLSINKIKYLTTLYTNLPDNYYLNILLTLHFADHLEKFMLTRQGDYNYAIDSSPSLLTPVTILLYLLDELEVYDPYCIHVILANIYRAFGQTTNLEITSDTGNSLEEVKDIVFKTFKNVPELSNLKNMITCYKEYTEDFYNFIFIEVLRDNRLF